MGKEKRDRGGRRNRGRERGGGELWRQKGKKESEIERVGGEWWWREKERERDGKEGQ